MVLPSGRWGRDPSSFAIPGGAGGGSSPTAIEPGEPKGPGSGGVPIDAGNSKAAGNSLTTGDNRQIGPDSSPIARDISIDAGNSKAAGNSNTAPVNAPFDYAQTEATETDITPSGTNKPSTGFGIGHLVAGAGLATLGLGMMGMNFFRRKKAPKEKDSDYEDGVMALAEGGEVGDWQGVDHYCQTCMPHQGDCEYFVEGGEVGSTPSFPNGEVKSTPAFPNSDWIEETPGADVAAPKSMEAPDSDWVEETPGAPIAPIADPDSLEGWVEEDTGAPAAPMAPVPEKSGLFAGTAAEGARALGAQAEAFAKGLIGGPIVAGAEIGLSALGIPGLSAKDQAAREADLPVTTGLYRGFGTGVSYATGRGAAGVIGKIGATWGEKGLMSKIGGKYIADLVQGGVFGALNEVEKAIVQGDDHEMLSASSMLHIGGQALLSAGLGAGGRFFVGLKDNVGTKYKSAAAGLAAYAAHPENSAMVNTVGKKLSEASAQGFKFSQSAYDAGVKFAEGLATKVNVATTGLGINTLADFSVTKLLSTIGFKVGAKLGEAGAKVAGPAFLNVVQKDSWQTLPNAMDLIGTFMAGHDTLNKAVGGLLKGHTAEWLRTIDTEEKNTKTIDMMKKALDTFVPEQEIQNSLIEANNEAPQGFAEGGQVEGKQQGSIGYSDLAESFPEQAMSLQMARGRMSTYLRSLQPQQQAPSLSFDSPPDTREQKRSYEKALLIAAQPLSVFGHIAKGTLEPEHIQHLNAIYPEVSNQMQKKLTENIMLMQLSGERPSYKTRQGLTLLLGAPLSSEFVPANIQAAQAVFIPAEATQQPGAKPTKLKQSLSKSAKSHMTDDQSRQFRMQKQ